VQDLTGKLDDTAGPTGELSAPEWNQLPQEVQNVITSIGTSLSSGSLDQLQEAVADLVAVSDFYTGAGTVNAITLSAIGTRAAPPAYVNGMRIRFRPPGANTSTTPTVNVAGLGVKTIVNEAGGPVAADDLDSSRDAECRYDGTSFRLLNRSLDPTPPASTPRRYIEGFITLNSGTHGYGVGAGLCRDHNDTVDISLASTLIKNVNAAWTAGTGNGGFPVTSLGAAANSTFYRVFVIRKNDGSVDAGYDSAANAANLLTDSGYNQYRQVGWALTTPSGQITPFYSTWDPEEIYWDTKFEDQAWATWTTAASLYSLTAPPDTQALITVANSVSATAANESPNYMLATSTFSVDTAPSVSNFTDLSEGSDIADAGSTQTIYSSNHLAIACDATPQVRLRGTTTSSRYDWMVLTRGFKYRRGVT
jgi:hypothetical protein